MSIAILVLVLSSISNVWSIPPPPELYSGLIAAKVLATAQAFPNPPKYPQYTDRELGKWLWFQPNTWTSAFFPTTLYAMNTRDTLCPRPGSKPDWVNLARAWSTGLIPLELRTTVGHDVGFLSFPFVEELLINPQNQTAVTAVVNFANKLAARYSPIVQCTRSWDDTADPEDFQVIIDNMMNLEVLFVAEALTGNQTYRDIAIAHADKTIINHVRPDGSSNQVVDYNSTTGAVIGKRTVQGYSNESTWSRGQAWGIYGFTNMHINTGFSRYLDTARAMAWYFLSNIPDDGVVPWDFNAPTDPPRPADSSAATIAATALLMLSQQERSVSPPNSFIANYWRDAAINILSNTTSYAWRPEWESLLANGTVNNPLGNNMTGIVYGDYYYIKAGNNLLSMGLTTCADIGARSV